MRITVCDSCLCCTCVTYFERQLTPLFLDSARALSASFYFRFLSLFGFCFVFEVWSALTEVKVTLANQVFVVVFVRGLSNVMTFPCLLSLNDSNEKQ